MDLERRTKQGAEAQLGKREGDRRAETQTLEELSHTYDKQADALLSGRDGASIKDEISRFAKAVKLNTGAEQYEELGRLVHALHLRKPKIFEVLEDEHERAAFALSLVEKYEKSLH
jgi:hypothetical protein